MSEMPIYKIFTKRSSKKWSISSLLIIWTLIGCFQNGKAAQFYLDGIAYFYINGTTVVEVRDNHIQSYKGNIVIPEEVTEKGTIFLVEAIGFQAFYDCAAVTAITLPASIISVGESAFSGCEGLTSFIIPEKVEKMGKRAFYQCRNLEKVTISNHILGEKAFFECPKLTEIHLLPSQPPIINDSFDNYQATLYVPIGSKTAYQNAPGWRNFKKIVEK